MFCGTTSVSAQDVSEPTRVARQINEANATLRQGDIDSAIQQYQALESSGEANDTLAYNLAVAQYRKGDLAAAENLFQQTATTSDNTIAADSRYNLGNCRYAAAIQTAQQDKAAAIEQLREAIRNYRSSLRLNADNPDARANIELAAEMIRKLEEEQKKEEEQKQQEQQQDQQQQESQDQQQQNQQQQDNSQSDQNEQQDNQSQDDQQQNESQQQRLQIHNNPTNRIRRRTRNQNNPRTAISRTNNHRISNPPISNNRTNSKTRSSKTLNRSLSPKTNSNPMTRTPEQQSQDQQQDSQSSKENDQQKQNAASQADASKRQSQSQQSAADAGEQTAEEDQQANEQSVPTGELTAEGEKPDDQKPNGRVAVADPNAKDKLMTKQEAMKMLQAVRDRDMLRRLRQQHQERSRHVPTNKDW